jgi:hypothetical protein
MHRKVADFYAKRLPAAQLNSVTDAFHLKLCKNIRVPGSTITAAKTNIQRIEHAIASPVPNRVRQVTGYWMNWFSLA